MRIFWHGKIWSFGGDCERRWTRLLKWKLRTSESCARDARETGGQNFRGLHEGDAPFWHVRGKAYTPWHICTRVGNVTYLSCVFTYRIDARRGRTFISFSFSPLSVSLGARVSERTGVCCSSTRLDSEWWSISLLVFHRFQSIKLVALVLPSADHAGAIPFFCPATISVVFRVSLPFYSRSGWSAIGGCNPPACPGENNARKAFVAFGKRKDFPRLPKLCRGACHAQELDWRNNRIDFVHLLYFSTTDVSQLYPAVFYT